jgi:TRAP-type C4-dicarboxylate transport system permease small subunit
MRLPSPPSDEGEGAPPAPSALDRGIGAIAWFAAAVGAGVVLLMMSVVVYSVVNRYLLGTPVTWTDELSGYLVVALVMLGAAEALRRGDHISVDLITSRLGSGARRLADVWGNLLVLVVAVSLLISGKATIEYSVNFDILSEGYLEVPMWIPQSFLILGAGLLALVAVANLLRLVKKHGAP